MSSYRLYLIGGAAQGTKQVRLHGRASNPIWSHDGQWLAVQVSPTPPKSEPYNVEPISLWLVSPAGVVVRRLTAANPDLGDVSWSPTADVLALSGSTGAGNTTKYYAATVTTSGTVSRLTTSSDISGVAWSPDGDQIAASVGTFAHRQYTSRLEIFPAAGGSGRVITTEHHQVLDLAGWWPDGSGLLAWLDYQGSSSLAADGLPLLDVSVANGHRRRLAHSMLQYGEWLSRSAKRNEIAFIGGGDRELTNDHKHLEVCSLSRCQSIHQPKNQVSFDPEWSTSGDLFLVRDRDIAPTHGFGPRFFTAVQNSGTVHVIKGTHTHVLSDAGSGATAPLLGRGGAIMELRHDELWIIGNNAKVHRVTGVIKAESDYYGYVPWSDTISWIMAVPQ